MDTPYQNHIDKDEFNYVYEPAEDSFLLIDALEKEIDFLRKKNPLLCLEVGSGSGVVITAFAMAFPHCLCFCTDINHRACLMSQSTASHNKVFLECVNMNLVTCFVDKKFDVLIFNPPYVETESNDCLSNGIVASWAGGIKGREITDKLLDMVPKILTDDGIFYLLLIKENIPEEVKEIMLQKGFQANLVLERKVKNEHQIVIKFYR
ncbi:unnamed protein product [Leptidea sinapis]|uniref:Methyltransferase HEMK2 n=1 Tax=Leptidea sinapis TaxID=189913 RepID=A0A5E4Q7Y5_9NEOP|nr:unnamed protein product [Leptidea sinapis]